MMKKPEINNMQNKITAIHIFLQKTKNRAIVLVPPLFICIVIVVYAFGHIIFGLSVPPFAFPILCCATIWLAIGLCVALWSRLRSEKQIKYSKV